jgi:hypothetical protein
MWFSMGANVNLTIDIATNHMYVDGPEAVPYTTIDDLLSTGGDVSVERFHSSMWDPERDHLRFQEALERCNRVTADREGSSSRRRR